MSAWDFNSELSCDPCRIHPAGGTVAVQELAQALQARWPEITPDLETERSWGPKRLDLFFLHYIANGQVIDLRIDYQNDSDAGSMGVLLKFRCENPPEVRQPFLAIMEWLMSEYGMECSPGWALSESPTEDDIDDRCYTSFQEALPALNKFLDRTWLFWRTNYPDRCGSWARSRG